MALQRKIQEEFINVHRVMGSKDAIIFLKNSDHDFVEGLFYSAKKYGKVDFIFQEMKYVIRRNKDFSFTVEMDEQQELSTEEFA